MTVGFEVTFMPCGRDCGTTYSQAGLTERVEIQRAALEDGWKAEQIDGKHVLVCTNCAGQDRSEVKT